MEYTHWHDHIGFCPKLRCERTIHIKYIEFQPNDYKKMTDDYCDEQILCEFLDDYGRCPLYIKAPDEPI